MPAAPARYFAAMKSLLRKAYYAVPVGLRGVVRRLYYLPLDLLRPLPAGAPPRGKIYTGGDGEELLAQGVELVRVMRERGLLDDDTAVLDIGSGIGRFALALAAAGHRGPYEGFDVVATGVAWCEANITREHPNFSFRHVELANDLYTGRGASAREFTFPYAADRFDLLVANSVFTHMLSDEVSRYVREGARVARPGARGYFTAFILDEASRAAMYDGGGFVFGHPYGEHARLLDAEVKRANVAYERDWLLAEFAAAGWRVDEVLRGRWSGLPGDDPVAFQDVVLATRVA